MKECTDVVLDFPFKDCILSGGQSSEENKEVYFECNQNGQSYTKQTRKRQEIFFNQVLAFDEIDRLFDRKALSHFSRYTQNGNQAVGTLKRHPDGTLAENLLIKGNNLLALHSLATQFKGKVKLIYIDPPYNTGSDSFKYNDNFNHSSWLVFMKNRLEIAKELLRDDGVIFVQCDDHEQAYLKVLMDEIFGRENFVNTINPEMSNASGNKIKHAIQGKKFPKLKEYLHLYAKNKNLINLKIPKYQKEKWDNEYNQILTDLTYEEFCKIIEFSESGNQEGLDKILNRLSISSLSRYIDNNKTEIVNKWKEGNIDLISDKNLTDDHIQKLAIEDWKWKNAYRIIATKPNKALRNKAIEMHFDHQVQSIINPSGDLKIIITNFNRETPTARIEVVFAEINSKVFMGDIWFKIVTTGGVAQEGGVSFTNGKKPEQLLEIIINSATNPNDIVLDYHLGSGTTCAVAHKMGRQWIGIEQMDYIEDISKTRLLNVLDGEQSGISKAVNWQGGGEFIYCELASFNEDAKNLIKNCENFDRLQVLFNELYDHYFLKYNVNIEQFKKIMQESEFQQLPLDEQKQMMLEMLDLNQLYVNYSDMNDAQFKNCLSDEDKALSHQFYGEKA